MKIFRIMIFLYSHQSLRALIIKRGSTTLLLVCSLAWSLSAQNCPNGRPAGGWCQGTGGAYGVNLNDCSCSADASAANCDQFVQFDFGVGSSNQTLPEVYPFVQTQYGRMTSPGWNEFLHIATSDVRSVRGNNQWDCAVGNTSGLGDDRYLLVNGSSSTGEVFRMENIGVLAGRSYDFGLDRNEVCINYSVNPPEGCTYKHSLRVQVLDSSDGSVLADNAWGEPSDWCTWETVTGSFTSPTSGQVTFVIIEERQEAIGTDFVIDNIYFYTDSCSPCFEGGACVSASGDIGEYNASCACICNLANPDADCDGDYVPNGVDCDPSDASVNYAPTYSCDDGDNTTGPDRINSSCNCVGAPILCTDPDNYDDTCDYDGDGIPNINDLDDDNDGILDVDECATSSTNNTSSTYDISDIETGINGYTLVGIYEDYYYFHRSVWVNSNSLQRRYYKSSFNPTQFVTNNGVSFTAEYVSLDTEGLRDFIDANTTSGTRLMVDNTSPGGATTPVYNGTTGQTIVGAYISQVQDGAISEQLNNYNAETAGGSFSKTNFGGINGGWALMKVNVWIVDCSTLDADTDGIPDKFDIDSDNDGCHDAIEGGGSFTGSDLQINTNLYPNTNPNNDPQYQLGAITDVDSDGVPNLASGGQSVGSSLDAATQDASCSTQSLLAADDTRSGTAADVFDTVFDNDNANGTTPATDALVSRPVWVSGDFSAAELDFRDDGTFKIPPLTPNGTYSFVYKICLESDRNYCDQAQVDLTIMNQVGCIESIQATQDILSGLPGDNVTTSILDNDLANGATPATTSLVSVTSAPVSVTPGTGLLGLSFNSDGTFAIPSSATPGVYTVQYEICLITTGCPDPCSQADMELTVVNPCELSGTLTVKGVDPTTCGGNDGYLEILGLNMGSLTSVNASWTGISPELATGLSQSGSALIISNRTAGEYNNLRIVDPNDPSCYVDVTGNH